MKKVNMSKILSAIVLVLTLTCVFIPTLSLATSPAFQHGYLGGIADGKASARDSGDVCESYNSTVDSQQCLNGYNLGFKNGCIGMMWFMTKILNILHVLTISINRDNHHLLADIVSIFKGVTALRVFKKFPQLKEELWRGVLWSPSYYVGTAGNVSAETIEKYIQAQQTKWRRGWGDSSSACPVVFSPTPYKES